VVPEVFFIRACGSYCCVVGVNKSTWLLNHVFLCYLLAHLVAKKSCPVLSSWKEFRRLSSVLSGQPLTVKLYYLLSGFARVT